MADTDPKGSHLLKTGPRQLLFLRFLGRRHQGQCCQAEKHLLRSGGSGGLNHQEEMEQSEKQDSENGSRAGRGLFLGHTDG